MKCLQAESCSDCGRDLLRVAAAYRSEIHHVHVLRQRAPQLAADHAGEPGLPHSAHAEECHQARRGEQVLDALDLLSTTDKCREVDGKVAHVPSLKSR
ncbi:MAG: hypothetical protein FWE39_07525 [Nocardiaceae bacterium]|nr:hypothetical protein [Nocardiaceae bacterium]